MFKTVTRTLVFVTLMFGIAAACPDGYHEETRTDPCGRKENRPTCVQWDADNNCSGWQDNWVCVPTYKTTCEPD